MYFPYNFTLFKAFTQEKIEKNICYRNLFVFLQVQSEKDCKTYCSIFSAESPPRKRITEQTNTTIEATLERRLLS